MSTHRTTTLALGLASALCCAPTCACVDAPVELFEGELVLGRLDADERFVAYALDEADGRLLVEVVRGYQGADMIVLVLELAPAHVGERVDFGCRVETQGWSSGTDALLHDVLVGPDGLAHAPFVILGWWAGEVSEATISCEVHGPTRADVTSLDARLLPEEPGTSQ